MKVYRFLLEDELNKIINNETSRLGSVYNAKKPKNLYNTFRYKQGVKYLHFFKNKKDCVLAKRIHINNPQKAYICTFDIPAFFLLIHSGTGYYPPHGYDLDHESVREFAIESSTFNTKWLVSSEPYEQAMKEQETENNDFVL